eukprot:PITA_31489
MKTLFSSQDIWDLVENGFHEPADAVAYNVYIFQVVHENIFPRVAAATKSKQAWDTLQKTYQGMEKVNTTKLQMLRRDFETLCMKYFENVDSLFTHVIGLVTQIRSHGETLEERRIVKKVLRSLPARLNRATSSSLEHAFKLEVSFGQGRGRGRSYARGRGRNPHIGGRRSPSSSSGRGSNQNPSQGPSQNQARGLRYDKSQVQCHYCKKYGHYTNECRNKQYDINNKASVDFTKENQNHDSMFLACNVQQEKKNDIWYLDSGRSNHMSGNIEMVSNLEERVKSEVTLGTNSKVFVMGKGIVNILKKKGEKKYISDVYFVPGLKHNLMSIRRLMQKG